MKKLSILSVLCILNGMLLVAQEVVNLNENLLLHYKFDGDVIDSSDNEYNGVLNATFVKDRFDASDKACHFNGINEFVDLPNIVNLKPQLPITISMWVKFESLGITNTTAFTTDFTRDRNTGVFMSLNGSTQTIAVGFGDGGGTTSSSRRSKYGTTLIEQDIWYFFVYVMKGAGDIEIYYHEYDSGVICKNDGGQYTGSGSNTIGYGDAPGTIGRNDINGVADPYYFIGSIDEFQMWNKSLSESEVLELCEVQKSLSIVDDVREKLSVFSFVRDKDVINIRSEIKICQVLIYDSVGRLKFSRSGNGIKEINTETLINGVYYIKALNEKGKYISTKIII